MRRERVCEKEEFTQGRSWVNVERQARIPISFAVYIEAMLWMHYVLTFPLMEYALADFEFDFEPSERQMLCSGYCWISCLVCCVTLLLLTGI